jgi:hypothetical protein
LRDPAAAEQMLRKYVVQHFQNFIVRHQSSQINSSLTDFRGSPKSNDFCAQTIVGIITDMSGNKRLQENHAGASLPTTLLLGARPQLDSLLPR